MLKNNAIRFTVFFFDLIKTFFLNARSLFLVFISNNLDSQLLQGHLNKDALAASALSDLWTMTTSVLLSGRILGVLIGGAVGAGNPKLAGEADCATLINRMIDLLYNILIVILLYCLK